MMVMGFFQKQKNIPKKNILVLGMANSGKKSLILRYKDGVFVKNDILSRDKEIGIIRSFAETSLHLNFIVDNASDGFAPSIEPSAKTYDLVLIIVDASSDTLQEQLDSCEETHAIHFTGVPLLVVLTKMDKKNNIEPQNDKEITYTSALDGSGIDEFHKKLEKVLSSSITPQCNIL